MKLLKPIRLAICAVAAGILLYFFPLVRIRKLGSAATPGLVSNTQSEPEIAAPNGTPPPQITTFVETLWSERLPQAAGNAASVDDVLAMAATDADRARSEFGREVGLGGPTFLFLRGRGRIESFNEDECHLIIEGQKQSVTLEIGILLGNAVRDATGLVSIGEFPNSQEFNRLSAELNQRCESEVISPVRDSLAVGALVEFVGCGEVRKNNDFDPLRLVPIQLNAMKPAESTE
ncbi:DUF2291 family protein [Bythopirellula polymerisocia]|uniref:Periplasmic lipoprotein n=1 Tax=Bythopirellula polymerisocia TaxID=2528003 RepID=A0A5C6CQ01_9BACT|nr:DUF2291 family protein [Bythopirellula polymerisocia]TWU25564.1 hypothetical protein Pla144_27710 [Bythopirellula polymerisocia]